MKKSTHRLIKQCAEKAKVTIESISQNSKHIKVLVRAKKIGVVFVSATASDYRAFQNVITDMRRVAND